MKTAIQEYALQLVVAALMVALGYYMGFDHAEAKGLAAVRQLQVDHSEEKRRASDAYGKALADALGGYRAEVARADALVAEIAAQDRSHADTTQKLRRQIAHVASSSTCTLGPDTVRLLNEAAGISDDALYGALCAPGADGEPAACAAPDARLLEGVSEADLVAWFVDYADRACWLESRLAGWQQWYRERTITRGDTNGD